MWIGFIWLGIGSVADVVNNVIQFWGHKRNNEFLDQLNDNQFLK
jgi:hypothetical protein